MSPSKMRKTRAYSYGEMHADGGEDTREQFAPKQAWHEDHRAAYDLGYREQTEYLARQRAPVEDDPREIIRDLLATNDGLIYSHGVSDAIERAERFLGDEV
ncbi:MAG: hypothetical protein JSS54_06755 [Proteobacteria bacterium]|nr:hypothetical protein [Pseudomonadota bacterium]